MAIWDFYSLGGSFLKHRIVKFLAQKAIGTYVKENVFSEENIQFLLGEGKLQLKNVEANIEAINERLFDLPFRVSTAKIASLAVTIPWKSIKTSPMTVEINDATIELCLALRRKEPSLSASTFLEQYQLMLEEEVKEWEGEIENDDIKGVEDVPQTIFQSLASSVISRMKLSLNNVSLRFPVPSTGIPFQEESFLEVFVDSVDFRFDEPVVENIDAKRSNLHFPEDFSVPELVKVEKSAIVLSIHNPSFHVVRCKESRCEFMFCEGTKDIVLRIESTKSIMTRYDENTDTERILTLATRKNFQFNFPEVILLFSGIDEIEKIQRILVSSISQISLYSRDAPTSSSSSSSSVISDEVFVEVRVPGINLWWSASVNGDGDSFDDINERIRKFVRDITDPSGADSSFSHSPSHSSSSPIFGLRIVSAEVLSTISSPVSTFSIKEILLVDEMETTTKALAKIPSIQGKLKGETTTNDSNNSIFDISVQDTKDIRLNVSFSSLFKVVTFVSLIRSSFLAHCRSDRQRSLDSINTSTGGGKSVVGSSSSSSYSSLPCITIHVPGVVVYAYNDVKTGSGNESLSEVSFKFHRVGINVFLDQISANATSNMISASVHQISLLYQQSQILQVSESIIRFGLHSLLFHFAEISSSSSLSLQNVAAAASSSSSTSMNSITPNEIASLLTTLRFLGHGISKRFRLGIEEETEQAGQEEYVDDDHEEEEDDDDEEEGFFTPSSSLTFGTIQDDGGNSSMFPSPPGATQPLLESSSSSSSAATSLLNEDEFPSELIELIPQGMTNAGMEAFGLSSVYLNSDSNSARYYARRDSIDSSLSFYSSVQRTVNPLEEEEEEKNGGNDEVEEMKFVVDCSIDHVLIFLFPLSGLKFVHNKEEEVEDDLVLELDGISVQCVVENKIVSNVALSLSSFVIRSFTSFAVPNLHSSIPYFKKFIESIPDAENPLEKCLHVEIQVAAGGGGVEITSSSSPVQIVVALSRIRITMCHESDEIWISQLMTKGIRFWEQVVTLWENKMSIFDFASSQKAKTDDSNSKKKKEKKKAFNIRITPSISDFEVLFASSTNDGGAFDWILLFSIASLSGHCLLTSSPPSHSHRSPKRSPLPPSISGEFSLSEGMIFIGNSLNSTPAPPPLSNEWHASIASLPSLSISSTIGLRPHPSSSSISFNHGHPTLTFGPETLSLLISCLDEIYGWMVPLDPAWDSPIEVGIGNVNSVDEEVKNARRTDIRKIRQSSQKTSSSNIEFARMNMLPTPPTSPTPPPPMESPSSSSSSSFAPKRNPPGSSRRKIVEVENPRSIIHGNITQPRSGDQGKIGNSDSDSSLSVQIVDDYLPIPRPLLRRQKSLTNEGVEGDEGEGEGESNEYRITWGPGPGPNYSLKNTNGTRGELSADLLNSHYSPSLSSPPSSTSSSSSSSSASNKKRVFRCRCIDCSLDLVLLGKAEEKALISSSFSRRQGSDSNSEESSHPLSSSQNSIVIVLYSVELSFCLFALNEHDRVLSFLDEESHRRVSFLPPKWRVRSSFGFYILDNIISSPVKRILHFYERKGSSNSKSMMRFEIEVCGNRPFAPHVGMEELSVSVNLPSGLKINLDQDTLEFGIQMGKDLIESAESRITSQAKHVSANTEPSPNNYTAFFHSISISPSSIKLDYHPKRVRYGRLVSGQVIELLGAFPLDGIVISLPCVRISQIHAPELSRYLMSSYLSSMAKQVPSTSVLGGVGAGIGSLLHVGNRAVNVIWVPVEKGRKGGPVAAIVGAATASYQLGRSIASEAFNLTTSASVGVSETLEGIIAPPVVEDSSSSSSSLSNFRRRNQPSGIADGFSIASSSLSTGIHRAMDAIIAIPVDADSPAVGGGMIAASVRAIPVATLAPLAGGFDGIANVLFGFRNRWHPRALRNLSSKYGDR